VSLIITICGIIGTGLTWWTDYNFERHASSDTAHPKLAQQLNRLEANQVGEKIEKMDQRICDDPDNAYYKDELRKLIIEWETLTGKRYPTQLLRCGS
jgi:hypothetical protein